MHEGSVALKKLAERVLQKGGDLPLALLLEFCVPVRALRELAASFGVSPKGGFRLERAPAQMVAAVLAEQREPERIDKILRLLLPVPPVPPAPSTAPSARSTPSSAVTPPHAPGVADGDDASAAAPPPVPAPPAPAREATRLLELREAELQRARDDLERAR